jgi:uncharacterized protein DUF2829
MANFDEAKQTEGRFDTEASHLYPGFGIGWAIKQIIHGLRVRRRGWNGRGMYIALQMPDSNSKMSLPYVYISTVHGDLVPWLCSQGDLLAMDWEAATVPE